MADEPGATPDDAQDNLPIDATGGNAADSVAPDQHDEPQGFADFAREDLSRQLQDLEGRAGDGEGTAPDDGVDPAAGGAPAQQPNAGTQPGADGGPDVFANLRSAVDQIGDPQLAEQVQAHLTEYENYEREVSAWVQQVRDYSTQIEQREQQVNQRLQYLEQIASDPRFQQAIKAVTGQAGAPAPGTGTAPTAPNAGGNNNATPDFETDGERFLHQQLQAYQEKLAKFEQDQSARSAAEQKAQLAQYRERASATLQQLATTLPQKFPGLKMDKALHDKASIFIEGMAAKGETIDIEAAYEAAAKLLTYEAAGQQGAKRATQTARAAARSSNHPADARTTTTRQVNTIADAMELAKEQLRAEGKPIPAGV